MEAKRLLREVEWLNATGVVPEKILPLIESASALGAPKWDVIPLHLDCLFRKISSISRTNYNFPRSFPLSSFQFSDVAGHHLPVALDVSDRLAYELPFARKLLQQAALYFQQEGERELRRPGKRSAKNVVFCQVIDALSYIRAAIYEKNVPQECGDDFIWFSEELDAFTREYFAFLGNLRDPESWLLQVHDQGYRPSGKESGIGETASLPWGSAATTSSSHSITG